MQISLRHGFQKGTSRASHSTLREEKVYTLQLLIQSIFYIRFPLIRGAVVLEKNIAQFRFAWLRVFEENLNEREEKFFAGKNLFCFFERCYHDPKTLSPPWCHMCAGPT